MRKNGKQLGVSRVTLAIGLPIFGLLFSGCASLPGGGSRQTALQAEQIREQQLRAQAMATPSEKKPETLEEKLGVGDALRRDGNYAAAMWTYLQAHEMAPDDPEPTARMASLHLMEEPDRAESIFRELLETYPKNSAALTGLGLTLIAREDWAEARDTLIEAIGINPQSAAAYSALGVAQDRLGHPAEAREAYLQATALQPLYYEALNNLGVSYLATEEFEAAAKALREASIQQRRDPAVFNNLGLALGRMEDYDAAFDAFRRAGSEQVARNNVGYVAFLNGDNERAVEEYEQALLVGGDQRLLVLRNLVAAQKEKDLDGAVEN